MITRATTATASPTSHQGNALLVVTVTSPTEVVVLVAPSVATTPYVPPTSLGTLNVHANSPVAFVVMVVPLNVPTVHPVGLCNTPLKATVTDDDTENPLPVTVYVAPTVAWLGDTVIVGVVIVNNAVALSAPPSDPVAVNVYAVADEVPAIVTVQLNVPVPETVATQLVAIVAPEPIDVVTVILGVNPLPEIVTVAPLGPCIGVSVTAGVVIVKGAVALSKVPSEPVAVTAYAVTEAVPAIVTVQLNVPVPETVAPQLGVIIAPELIDVVTVAPGVNPLPETVTVTPFGPCVGERAIVGVVTLNVPLAWSLPESDPVAVTA